MWPDVLYSLRRLRLSPWSSAMAICTVGVAIGAAAAVFAHVNNALLKGPDLKSPRLVTLVQTHTKYARDPAVLGKYLAWLESQQWNHLDGLAAVGRLRGVLSTPGGARLLTGEVVTGSYFGLLGMRPLVGRPIEPADDLPGADHVLVISERVWRSSFGADPGIIGQSHRLGGITVRIVGVAPETFRGSIFANITSHDIWATRATALTLAGPLSERRAHAVYGVIARLGPGSRQAAADAEVRSRSRGFDSDNPGESFAVASVRETFAPPGAFRAGAFGALLLAVLVVGIALANLSGLFVTRVLERRTEIAIRLGLGASIGTVQRLLTIEAAILAGSGCLLGLIVAWWATRVFGTIVLPGVRGLPIRYDASPDWQFVAFSIGLLAICTAVAVRSPANRLLQMSETETLVAGGSRLQARNRVRLMAGQVAASIVLLTIAALVARSTLAAMTPASTPGSSRLVVAQIDGAAIGHDDKERLLVIDGFLSAVESVPAVDHAAIASSMPLGGMGATGPYSPADGAERIECRTVYVSDRYFSLLGLPILRGRGFERADSWSGEHPAVLSRAAAARLWPDEDPIGKRLVRPGRGRAGTEFLVIGIVGDESVRPSSEASSPERRLVYLPLAQAPPGRLALLANGRLPAAALANALQSTVDEVEPYVPVFDVEPFDHYVLKSADGMRVAAVGLLTLGTLGTMLGLVSVYGMVRSLVRARMRELAIRRALGASRWDIYQSLGRETLAGVTAGGAVGIFLAYLGAGLLATFKTDIRTHDPVTFIAVPLLVGSVCFIAAALGARPGVRANPAQLMRQV